MRKVRLAPGVKNWIGSGPQGPNLGWLDQKIGPISDSSQRYTYRVGCAIKDLFGLCTNSYCRILALLSVIPLGIGTVVLHPSKLLASRL